MNSIKEQWEQQYTDKKSSVEWWDSLASDFAEHTLPTAESSLTMRLIEREGMVTRNCHILDVGCGAGRFSVALAKLGANVCGTDISPKMIGYAQEAAAGIGNISFSLDDWHLLDLKTKGWDKRFNLVLANMTPAVASADTFTKLTEASKDWCLLVKPCRRINSVLDPLNEITGAPRDTKVLDETIAFAFELLWQAGYNPKLDYEPRVWHSKKPLEQAIFQYTKRIESFQALDDNRRQAIRDYLTSLAKDGMVAEETLTTIVAMYWRV